MKRTVKGEPLFKRMFFKVIVEDKVYPFQYVANAGNYFTEAHVERQLEALIEHIDKSFFTKEFRQVKLAANKFNFICIGPRKVNYGKHGESSEVSLS